MRGRAATRLTLDLQGTCPTWHQYSFCFTKYRHHDHAEVSTQDCFCIVFCSESQRTFPRTTPSHHTGLSFKTQALYVTVFVTRYLDLFYEWVSLYNFAMKLFFIGSSMYILYLMKFRFRPTQDPSIDTFRVEYLLGPSLLLSLIFNYRFSLTEVLWSFSIFLESVAILPQLFMLQRTGEAETITTHYLAALGAYRALYIPNWIYRCVSCASCLPRGRTLTFVARRQILLGRRRRPDRGDSRARPDCALRRFLLRIFHEVSPVVPSPRKS